MEGDVRPGRVARLRLVCIETGAVLFETEREVQERPWPDHRPWPKRVRAPERVLDGDGLGRVLTVMPRRG